MAIPCDHVLSYNQSYIRTSGKALSYSWFFSSFLYFVICCIFIFERQFISAISDVHCLLFRVCGCNVFIYWKSDVRCTIAEDISSSRIAVVIWSYYVSSLYFHIRIRIISRILANVFPLRSFFLIERISWQQYIMCCHSPIIAILRQAMSHFAIFYWLSISRQFVFIFKLQSWYYWLAKVSLLHWLWWRFPTWSSPILVLALLIGKQILASFLCFIAKVWVLPDVCVRFDQE